MVSRFAGATLGLLAFAVTILAGLWAGNTVTVVLSRAIGALFIFCFIGVALGAAAQAVVNEHRKRREEAALAAIGADGSALESASDSQDQASQAARAEISSTAAPAKPMGTRGLQRPALGVGKS